MFSSLFLRRFSILYIIKRNAAKTAINAINPVTDWAVIMLPSSAVLIRIIYIVPITASIADVIKVLFLVLLPLPKKLTSSYLARM